MRQLAILFVLISFAASSSASVIFSDNFESGNLNKWTIDGRQEGSGYAEVVSRNGSAMAHSHHSGYTEITIEKRFEYRDDLVFKFDMEAKVSSPYSSSSELYSAAGVMFDFYDAANNRPVRAIIARSSSSYLSTYYNPTPGWEVFEIQDDLLHSYTVQVSDILNYFDVNKSTLAYVNFRFWSYGSGTQTSLVADTWADNVEVIPEPATIVLFACGAIAVLRKKIHTA